jgi:hypothetical protein
VPADTCRLQLTKPPPVDEMMSWSVLTPCYQEDVLYPVHAEAAAQALGLAPPPASGPGRLSDLLGETEDSVSLMAYLRWGSGGAMRGVHSEACNWEAL